MAVRQQRLGGHAGASLIAWAVLMLAATGSVAHAQPVERFEFSRGLMGTEFRIVLYAADSAGAATAAERAFARIDSLNDVLSDYLPNSELNRLSARSGSGDMVFVSEDLWAMLLAAQQLSRESGGAFDVTVGPLTQLWRRAVRRATMPTDDELAAARRSVGYHLVELDTTDRRVRLNATNMRLDMGGIAKGHAVDEALEVLFNLGYKRALVDGGGDIAMGDPPHGQSGWSVQVSHVDTQGQKGSRIAVLSNMAIATSGAAFRYLEHNGIRYSHIVDPKTGLGLTVNREVTVVAPSCTEADALASAFSVLGPDDSRAMLDRRTDSRARFVEETGTGFRMLDIPGDVVLRNKETD